MNTPVGTSVPRAGALERVTGALRFAADIPIPDALHVALVTLPCARARINGIDTRDALALPGVHAVFTPADFPTPMPRFGPIENDRPLLAVGETKYAGEPVAAVAADSPDTASAASAAVRVEYEELPAVLSVAAARAADTPLVQAPGLRPDSTFARTNTYNEWTYTWGDSSECDADLVVTQRYHFPMVSHFAIEPHVFMAAPANDGGVHVWSTVQHPFLLQRMLAALLDIPVARIRVTVPDVGGAFGGKGYPKLEPLLAFMAVTLGRPVRLVCSLPESFQMGRRSSCEVHITTGFTRDGRLVFNTAESNYLIGAYADITARIVGKASYLACGPYRMPNVHVTGRALFSHTVPATAFRGFGAPQFLWALESQMDEAARRLKIDRVAIRVINLPRKGEVFVPGDTPCDGNWPEGLQKAARAVHWGTPLPPNRGRGVAIGIKSPKPGTVSQVLVRLHNDGSASVYAGTTELGQGCRTVFAQLCAQGLGIAGDKVHVHCGDTATAPFDSLTASSRSTVFMGNAVLDACQKIRARLTTMSAELLDLPPEEIEIADGHVVADDREFSYGAIIEHYYGPASGDVAAIGEFRQAPVPNHPLGGAAPFWEVIFFGAEVEVDSATGTYRVTNLSTVGDIGKAINPAHVEGQDQGGALMALGHTMMEHLVLDTHGAIRNLGALDYRIPTIEDIPDQFVSLLVENADGPGPFGAKGTGESGVLAVSPAVASAITEATGAVCTDLPITPEHLWHALNPEP